MSKQSLKEIPNSITNKYQVIKQFGTGGSSAGTLLVSDRKKGQSRVLKYDTWAGIGSSGIPWLRAQAARFIELKDILPKAVKDWIPNVYDIYDKNNLFYYTMQNYNHGHPLSFYYFDNPSKNINCFTNDINKILDFLSKYFYFQQKLNVPKDYIYKVHIEKIFYRLSFLLKREGIVYEKYIKNNTFRIGSRDCNDMVTFFSELMKSKNIIINDKEYLNAPFLINNYASTQTLKKLKPRFLPKYNHGDSTFRNYIKLTDRMVLIDIRGTNLPNNAPARVCIPYELGKMLRSFLLEVVRNNCFSIKISQFPNKQFNFIFNYQTQNKSVNNFFKIRSLLPSLFKRHDGLNEILINEQDWLMKSYFAEACHFLADASNRLESDMSGYQTIAYYLIGCQLLNDFNKIYF